MVGVIAAVAAGVVGRTGMIGMIAAGVAGRIGIIAVGVVGMAARGSERCRTPFAPPQGKLYLMLTAVENSLPGPCFAMDSEWISTLADKILAACLVAGTEVGPDPGPECSRG